MLVKYYMNSGCTYANMVADINGIVNGSITSTGGLSVGANTALTTFTGTYPSTYYSVANSAGAYTYMKLYNANTSTNNYFTIGFNGTTGISSLTLGAGYANSTNSYALSSYTYTFPQIIGIQSYASIDIIVNNNLFFINNPSVGSYGAGIFDMGYNGVTQAFTSGLTASLMPISNVSGSTAGSTLIPVNPYSWVFANSSYGTSNSALTSVVPIPAVYNSSGNVAVLENPVFQYNQNQGNSVSVVYGLNSITQGEYIARTTYVDNNSVYRYVVGSDSLTYSITIT